METLRTDPVRSRADTGLVALGTTLAILGVLAIVAPVFTSLSLGVLLGVVLVASGIAQFVHLFRGREGATRAIGHSLLATLSIVVGVLAFRDPVLGASGITLALTIFLFMSAFAKWSLASAQRPSRGRTWLRASSIVSLVLAAFLLMTFPMNSIVVPGVFLGVDLVFYGVTLVSLSAALGESRAGIAGSDAESRRDFRRSA